MCVLKKRHHTRTGMEDMMVALQYPWAIKQMIKAAPGPSWLMTNQTDDGHTLHFVSNAAGRQLHFCITTGEHALPPSATVGLSPDRSRLADRIQTPGFW